jgi:Holliday junction DNA helicase RuvB
MSKSIRPSRFEDVIGQTKVVERLRIMVSGCKTSSQPMPHTLIDGPPGLGKTTLACAIANEMGENLYTVNAATIRSVKTIIPYLMNMSNKSVLFIDEIHRLPKIVEEFLYPVMEDFRIDIILDKEPESIDLPSFTLVGATTSGGSLSQPFYDRFVVKEHLSFYTPEELAKLAESNSVKLNIDISQEHLLEIAKRSKGTPRILNARLSWYKNYTSYHAGKPIDIDNIFMEQGIDGRGLDTYDRMYIDALQKSRGQALGLKSLSAMTGIAIETIENSIEPYLVRMGYVVRTQKGRVLGKYK